MQERTLVREQPATSRRKRAESVILGALERRVGNVNGSLEPAAPAVKAATAEN